MLPKHNKVNPKKEETSITDVVARYLPYWPLFVIFLLISVAAAIVYLRYTLPVYEASATIIVKDEKKGYDDSKMVESLDMINTKKIIENEVEVLQSRTIINSVVKKLRLYAPIFQEGKVNTVSAYLTSPVHIELLDPEKASSTDKISLTYNKNTVTIDKKYTGDIDQWINTPYGTMRFIRNEKYKKYHNSKPISFSLLSVRSLTTSIMGNLKVSPSSKLSTVLNLKYRDQVPQRAEDILNELIAAYGNFALSEKNTLAKNTLAFIEERLSIVSKDLDSIEKKLQRYKSGSGAVDIGRQGQLYLENVSANDKMLTELNMQTSVLSQLEKAAESNNLGMIPSSLGVNDPALTQQMNNLSALQLQYEKLRATVAENNPLLLSIQDQINQIKPTILNNIQSQRKSLEQNKGNLYSSGGKYKSIISSIPQKERELVEISRDHNIKNGIYSFLLQKREESELSLASSMSDSRIVNYAQSSRFPVSPNRMIIIALAAVFAFGFPFLIITARETFSPRILYRSEIEALTILPVIGEVAFNKAKDELLVQSRKRTLLAEEFRKIRVSLLSLGIDSQHKKILVTSSISGEGKSFVAANLATSLSLTGKRVVLVDMDLHKPGLGKFFNINVQPGVSEYLMGEKSIKEVVTTMPGNDNLFYISSGHLQEDSSELLENGKVEELIAQLDAEYDVVIIDVAPVVLITDAYLISSLCDATLYIIRHKFTPKLLVKRMDNAMLVNPLKNPAVIFNGVKERGYYKSNYGYGYNYTYGYGKENKKDSVI